MSSEKNLHHFCFWHPPSFDFYMVKLSSGTNESFLPDQLKKIINPAGQPSGQFVILGISRFGFEGWIWVVFASVHVLSILFTFSKN